MQELIRVYKALGDENRLRILASLDNEERCVCALAKRLGIPQPTLSHHLKILRDAGLVMGEKSGPLIHCRISPLTFERYGVDLKSIVARVAIANRDGE
jgi:ArsR family transcriptional regulator